MGKSTNNQNLNNANKMKIDEFYTRMIDIEKEVFLYKDYFKNKKVLCNCDDYRISNFVNFFATNFNTLNLKQLTAISYTKKQKTEIIIIKKQINNFINAVKTKKDIKIITTNHNGDFRNKESIELLRKNDVVVTNPPFSLFRDFLDILIENNKDFLIIGNCNVTSNKKCFQYISSGKISIGTNCVRKFILPNNKISESARSYWFLNIDTKNKKQFLKLEKYYDKNNYLEYDNFHAIEIEKVKDIPLNYSGIMGVPITFLEKFNSSQFEILGIDLDVKNGILDIAKSDWKGKLDRAYLNGKRLYSRILIKNKDI
ncbi:adenine-specific methyltransferase EcoRI family protein [Campylobacter sp. 2018MI13]|uniref:adenine-specific methyltransferase EcoRI family protein n=1 Tax=Campylobacter sp. 2018MI13 TaxID=2836737 RepID=UPI001BDAB396|nr:adenine-specific methyltransferase EcoRI family protein [Campylobacter sp. 2018MI13]MBT0883151.1 adenosine deaminase [Campylobacter sp. 2018MI13]